MAFSQTNRKISLFCGPAILLLEVKLKAVESACLRDFQACASFYLHLSTEPLQFSLFLHILSKALCNKTYLDPIAHWYFL